MVASSSFAVSSMQVRCAIEVQNAMVERNVGVSVDKRIEFRVGIHLGDVVEGHDVAGLEGRNEELFDVGVEAFAVDRRVEQAGRIDAVVAQRGEEGRGLPAAMRNLVD